MHVWKLNNISTFHACTHKTEQEVRNTSGYQHLVNMQYCSMEAFPFCLFIIKVLVFASHACILKILWIDLITSSATETSFILLSLFWLADWAHLTLSLMAIHFGGHIVNQMPILKRSMNFRPPDIGCVSFYAFLTNQTRFNAFWKGTQCMKRSAATCIQINVKRYEKYYVPNLLAQLLASVIPLHRPKCIVICSWQHLNVLCECVYFLFGVHKCVHVQEREFMISWWDPKVMW